MFCVGIYDLVARKSHSIFCIGLVEEQDGEIVDFSCVYILL